MIRYSAGLGCLLLWFCTAPAFGQSVSGPSSDQSSGRHTVTKEIALPVASTSNGSTVASEHLQQIAEKKSWWSTPSWMKWNGGKSTSKKKSSGGFTETSKRWWGNIKKALDPYPDDLEPKTIDKPTIGDWQDLERPKF
ncbi:MAG: hypothetical protein ACKN81_13420 [Pirellulaceae bacterium]